ncbi:YqzL family protein [Jeotgalibacillus proteolyticus]|uniref:YqzL family protein n=1 Tax=Jeotgalibacillus proteolyticus TaxID=2082395 RepID=UPI003CF8861B
MLDFTWEVFSQTGNVELYLLFKEIEGQGEELKPETASQGESEYLSGSQIQI